LRDPAHYSMRAALLFTPTAYDARRQQAAADECVNARVRSACCHHEREPAAQCCCGAGKQRVVRSRYGEGRWWCGAQARAALDGRQVVRSRQVQPGGAQAVRVVAQQRSSGGARAVRSGSACAAVREGSAVCARSRTQRSEKEVLVGAYSAAATRGRTTVVQAGVQCVQWRQVRRGGAVACRQGQRCRKVR